MNLNDRHACTRLSRANTLHSVSRDVDGHTPLSSSGETPGNGEYGHSGVNVQVNTRPRQLSSSRSRAYSGSGLENSASENFHGAQGNPNLNGKDHKPVLNPTSVHTHTRKRLSMNFAALPISVNQSLAPANLSPINTPSSVVNGQNVATHYFHPINNSSSLPNPTNNLNANTTIPVANNSSTSVSSPINSTHHPSLESSVLDLTRSTNPLASTALPNSASTTSSLPSSEFSSSIPAIPGSLSKPYVNFRSSRRSLSLSIRTPSSMNRSTTEYSSLTEGYHTPASKQADPTMDYLNGLAVKERLVFELKEQMKRISEELASAEKELEAFRDHAPIALRPTSMMNSKSTENNSASIASNNSTLNANESYTTPPIALENLSENLSITPDTSFTNTPNNATVNNSAGSTNHRYSYGNIISQPLSMLDSLQSKMTRQKDRHNYYDSKDSDASSSRYHQSSLSNISNTTASSTDGIPEDSEDGFCKNFDESLIIGASYNDNIESNAPTISNSFSAGGSQPQQFMPVVVPNQPPAGDIVYVGKRVAAEIGKNFWGFMKDIKEVAMGEEESDEVTPSPNPSLKAPLEVNDSASQVNDGIIGSEPGAIALADFSNELHQASTEYFSDDMDISNFNPDQLSSPLSSSSVKTTFIEDSSKERSSMNFVQRSKSLLHRSKSHY
ncbi:hypothetical protein NADFUDRAFT_51249 [Nadsonia fulvescens var. elongata DSM 6958]|uniref:Uncharacterized protein n=1 Tax=Nadsonia fulvescens var. elongata DSM 6958 TaxID=857566 RepID=A0A1E3PKX5_9ASCO|nr:hypothetical protein NADFUDRAFT_51249 [Nadsonia fulvescens var. elongata DSM 6958]